jgi:hypothetical protein
MMKAVALASALFLVVAAAPTMASACVDFTGGYLADGVDLEVVQTGCETLATTSVYSQGVYNEQFVLDGQHREIRNDFEVWASQAAAWDSNQQAVLTDTKMHFKRPNVIRYVNSRVSLTVARDLLVETTTVDEAQGPIAQGATLYRRKH